MNQKTYALKCLVERLTCSKNISWSPFQQGINRSGRREVLVSKFHFLLFNKIIQVMGFIKDGKTQPQTVNVGSSCRDHVNRLISQRSNLSPKGRQPLRISDLPPSTHRAEQSCVPTTHTGQGQGGREANAGRWINSKTPLLGEGWSWHVSNHTAFSLLSPAPVVLRGPNPYPFFFFLVIVVLGVSQHRCIPPVSWYY